LGAPADRAEYRPKELVDVKTRQLPEVSVRKVSREVFEELITPSPMEIQCRFSNTAMMLKEREVLVEQCLKRVTGGRHGASFLPTRGRTGG
jgi:hypothetical protein